MRRLTLAALSLLAAFYTIHAQSAHPAADQVQAIIDQAEAHYKLGELSLKDRNIDAARTEFDKSVDAVLESGMDVRSNPKLKAYYDQLIEKINRIEATQQRRDVLSREQKFEPSPLDDLAGLAGGDVSTSPRRNPPDSPVAPSLLPQTFRPLNPWFVYKLLSSVDTQKGEFETTKNYEERISKWLRETKVGDTSLEGDLAFAVPADHVDAVYNADDELLVVKLKTDMSWVGESPSAGEKAVRLQAIYDKPKSYIGRNAFGVTVRIRQQFSSCVTLVFSNLTLFGDYDVPPAAIRLSAQDARRIKPNMRAFAIVKITHRPFVSSGLFVDKPTITDPTDYSRRYFNINAQLIEVWFVDGSTGKICAKQRPVKNR